MDLFIGLSIGAASGSALLAMIAGVAALVDRRQRNAPR
jgi:hypothetical protein